MSPAPNSTYRDTDEIESVSDMQVCVKIAKEKKYVKKVHYRILTFNTQQIPNASSKNASTCRICAYILYCTL